VARGLPHLLEHLALEETVKPFDSKDAVVGIVGLGYVGLPLMLTFGRKGFKVVGFDIDPSKIEALKAGKSYIRHIGDAPVSELRDSGRMRATSNFAEAKDVDALLLCVPTPLNAHREPDMRFVEATARSIGPHVKKGQLVVLESTTYPGTTDELLLKILEEESGLKAGTDFYLAYSPEREDPGNPNFDTQRIPKVVGGLTEDCLAAATDLYRGALDEVIPVGSTRVAEMSKLLENIFRSVNIALVNELKVLCQRMDVDVWDVIAAASTKPFGFMPFFPGPGLGGHCIPIDPFYLAWKAREYELSTRFIELAGEVNSAMPRYVVDRTAEALNDQSKPLKGSKILVLGLAYKKDVDDCRESPSFKVIDLLEERGAEVAYHDPHIPVAPKTRKYDLERASVALTPENLGSFDAALIITDHSDVDYAALVEHCPLVIDTRNAVRDPGLRTRVFQA
jgi:UDP-N-acetyl-D-glucosamine dehydrogenase